MSSLLIVEDSKSFASLLRKRITDSLNLEVVLARTMAEAKEKIKQAKSPFFLSILDLHLPDAVNGEIVDYVVAQHIPVIVLTSEYGTNLRKRILSKGALDYFIKDNISVIDAVIYFIDRLRRNQQTKVLVVDDSKSFRELLCQFLQRYGFSVLQAASGAEALEILANQQIRMVLTDYQMPEMDGFQLTKKIRARYSRETLAVIGLSSQGDTELASKFIKAGANDFLVKPFQSEELFCRVSQNVELVEKYYELELLVRERTSRLEETFNQLTIRKQKLQSILETALDAIITMDQEGRIINFNPAAEMLFGYARQDVLGKDLAELIIPKNYQETHRSAIKRLSDNIRNHKTITRRMEVNALRANGDPIDLELALTSMLSHGQLTYTGFMHDITERKQLVKSLEETLTVAETANRSKSEFLANMSHEIRTPMNAVIGMTDLVLQTSLNHEQREYLEIVQKSSQALLELINSILDLSKIEAGRVKLEHITFDLRGRVEGACETIAIRAHEKGLELLCYIAPDVPETLISDPLRLTQILINLLNNAIKFTTTGEIQVRVERQPEQEQENTPEQTKNRQSENRRSGTTQEELIFSISDTGIGIAPERVDTIFERFTQADGSTTRQFGGTGLGLTISQHLVRMMGGEFAVESKENHGTVFQFNALFQRGQRTFKDQEAVMEERSNKPPASPLANLQILTVYPNRNGRVILTEMLREFGAIAHEAEDISALLDALTLAHEAKRPYDVVILDHSLLEDDHPIAEKTFSQGGWLQQAVILLPTTLRLDDCKDLPEVKQRISLRKPVKKYHLLRTINQLLGREARSDEQTTTQQVHKKIPKQHRLNILLVEDLLNNQKLATTILEQVGHNITVANHGKEALQHFAHTNFDLILMDLHMPELDGYETTRAIRSGESAGISPATIPIIAVTSYALESEKQSCLQAGMNGFLRKPYRSHELLDAIEPFIKQKKHSVPPRSVPRQQQERKAAVGATLTLKPVNLPEETQVENRNRFIQESPKHMAALEKGFDNQRSEQVCKEAEWLKNAAATIGASKLKAKATRLRGKAEMRRWNEVEASLKDVQQDLQEILNLLGTL